MPQSPVTPERIMQYGWAYALPLAMEAGVRHRVFDVLDNAPKTLEDTAAATGASLRGLRALMNLLAGMGLLSRNGDGRFSLAPDAAAFLVSGKPGFLGGMTKRTSTQFIPEWLQLNQSVADGKPVKSVNQQGPGAEFFQDFVLDLFPMGFARAQSLAEQLAPELSTEAPRVLDLAAGSAVFSLAFAQRLPRATVTVVDWEGVLPAAQKMVGQFGFTDRYEFVAGDLAQARFGEGHQLALLGNILHSEGVERSRALLRKTFAALAPGGTIAIAEFLPNDDRSGPLFPLIFAVNMLLMTDEGDTFSFEEIAQWLRDAGFENPRLVQAPGPSPIIVATRPGQ